MKIENEIHLGRSSDLEILIGTILGSAVAFGLIWFATVLVLSLG